MNLRMSAYSTFKTSPATHLVSAKGPETAIHRLLICRLAERQESGRPIPAVSWFTGYVVVAAESDRRRPVHTKQSVSTLGAHLRSAEYRGENVVLRHVTWAK